MVILRLQDGELVKKLSLLQPALHLLHEWDGPTIHGLQRIFGESVFEGYHKLNVRTVHLQPARDALIQFVSVLQHQRSVSGMVRTVKGKHGVAAVPVHVANQLARGRSRQAFAEQRFTIARPY